MVLNIEKSFVMPIGRVNWVLEDLDTGEITRGKNSNIVVNYAREQLANAIIGTSVTFPGFIAVGTGTNTPAASDTALQTLSQYDGANDAKAVDTKSIRTLYTSRFTGQFITTEANITIREIGLFDAANSGNMWARVAVNITKTSSQRLTIYWYITFERSTGVPIKTGSSIAATGTSVAATPFTLTFASTVTVCIVTNNSGEKMYFRINQALDAGDPPVSYDFILGDGESKTFKDEEIGINTISCYATNVYWAAALPKNELSAVGW